MNALKVTQIELLYFFHFMCIASKAPKLFCMAHLANIKRFLYHSNRSFKYQILHKCKLASMS